MNARIRQPYWGIVLALSIALIPATVNALTIDDFTIDTTNALFFSFDVVNGSNGTPNSNATDLGNLDFGLAVSIVDMEVLFEFVNRSSTSSVFTQIYFDDRGNALMNSGAVISSVGTVSFAIGSASPPNLPGGNNLTPAFVANPALSAAANNPSPKKGVNPGENLVLGYNYLVDPADVLDALLDGTLRVGMHVQSIGTGGNSDAFIAVPFDFPDPPDPQAPIAEPATVLLLGMGTSFLAWKRRRG